MLALWGRSGSGVTAIIAALASLVGVFVYGKKRQTRELEDKAKTLPPPAEENEQH